MAGEGAGADVAAEWAPAELATALASYYTAAQVDTALAGKAALVHTHAASDLASGTLDDARLSSNVAMRNAANTFEAQSTYANNVGIAGTNAFLIADEASKHAVIFDAPDHTVGPLLDEIDRRGLDLIGLWLTHGHFDHVADHKVVTDRFPKARVLMHEFDAPKLRDRILR